MDTTNFTKLSLLKFALWGIILLSSLALVYHIRWFIPYILNSVVHRVPNGQSPFIWFIVQITSNIIFLYVGYLLIRLFNNHQKTGYFEQESLRIFDGVIISCLGLALLSIFKLAFSNFYTLPLNEYSSLNGIVNFVLLLIIDTITFKEPQTMYFLLALILWAVKQFVTKALFLKTENESFV